MIYQAVLGNPAHPEYGVATIPFPLPREEYDHSMEILDALEIGDAVKQDCKVEEIMGGYPVLKRLEGQSVNVDELDYLAMRLDSFCIGEDAQFQAMAAKLDLTDIKDFINLTFCCQQATVITDFSDLAKVGRDHYINLNGCVTTEELDKLDGEGTARQLIDSGEGVVTLYGVLFSMKFVPAERVKYASHIKERILFHFLRSRKFHNPQGLFHIAPAIFHYRAPALGLNLHTSSMA